MKVMSRSGVVLPVVGSAILLIPETALAYGGPGSIVTGVGALLAAVAAVAAAVFGFLWFPAKKLYRKLRGEQEKTDLEPAREGAND